jgi:hypothetical protein
MPVPAYTDDLVEIKGDFIDGSSISYPNERMEESWS